MIPALREARERRERLIARSAAQRAAIAEAVRPSALRLAAAESLLDGLARVLTLAARLAPLYAMLRRP